MAQFTTFDPCLDPSEVQAIRDLAVASGPYTMYVSAPKTEGLGAGLIRRHDAALNHLRHSMRLGTLESLEHTAARTNLFRGTWTQDHRGPGGALAPLLDHQGFAEAARALLGCPIVVPCELHANFLLPGQELAIHTDTPEYRGISKREVPEWLLVVMGHSGLFESWRIPIATAVAFFSTCTGGDFILFPQGPTAPAVHLSPRNNTAVALNTDDLFHGVQRVGQHDEPAPPAAIGMELAWTGDAWQVGEPGEAPAATWGWDEVRFSLQWKAYGYKTEEDRRVAESGEDELTYEAVLELLVDDLRERGLVEGELPDDTQLALLAINTYVDFPEAALGEA